MVLKRILYISYDGLTDPLGQSQILPYLQKLSKLGYRFTILSFEKRERFIREKDIIRGIVDQSGISWHYLFFTPKPPILAKIYDRYRMQTTAKSLCKEMKFDMVHCRSYVAAEVGLQLKNKFGVKMLFDMRGFWADEKVDNGQWNLNNFIFRRVFKHYKQKEREFLLSSEGIISLTHAAKNYLLKEPGYQSLNIDVIPCCADLSHFDFHKIDYDKAVEVKKKLQIPAGAKIITYLGSIGGWYMIREMLAFYKNLQKLNPQYVMLILTKDDEEIVKAEAIACGISPDKIFITYSERSMLPLYLSLSDCSIFFIRNTFSKLASSPTKHGELMGMGIPVICNDIGDTGWIINQTQTGLIINEFNEECMSESINKVSSLEQSDKEAIRNSAFQFFDLHAGAGEYAKVYRRILQD